MLSLIRKEKGKYYFIVPTIVLKIGKVVPHVILTVGQMVLTGIC